MKIQKNTFKKEAKNSIVDAKKQLVRTNAVKDDPENINKQTTPKKPPKKQKKQKKETFPKYYQTTLNLTTREAKIYPYAFFVSFLCDSKKEKPHVSVKKYKNQLSEARFKKYQNPKNEDFDFFLSAKRKKKKKKEIAERERA